MSNSAGSINAAPNRVADLLDHAALGDGERLKDAFQGDTKALLEYRKRLVAQIDAVDDLLVATVDAIRKELAGPQAVPVAPNTESVAPNGVKRRGINMTRNGKPTDTGKIFGILQKHGGSMTRAELVKETSKLGMRNPESALWSLKDTGMITRDNGIIKVVS